MPFQVIKRPGWNPVASFRVRERGTGKEFECCRCKFGSIYLLIPPANGRRVVTSQEIDVRPTYIRRTESKNFLGGKIPCGVAYVTFTLGREAFVEKLDSDEAFDVKYERIE